MVLGRNDWDAFDEKHFSNKQIIEVMKRIKVDIDPKIESRYPSQRGSIVKVEIKNGKPFLGKVNYPLGEPENPLPFSITREKFRAAAGTFLSKKSINRIEGILDISSLTDSAESLFQILSENKAAQRGPMK
jgi:2-methylcitrate dehydratase PrpD